MYVSWRAAQQFLQAKIQAIHASGIPKMKKTGAPPCKVHTLPSTQLTLLPPRSTSILNTTNCCKVDIINADHFSIVVIIYIAQFPLAEGIKDKLSMNLEELPYLVKSIPQFMC